MVSPNRYQCLIGESYTVILRGNFGSRGPRHEHTDYYVAGDFRVTCDFLQRMQYPGVDLRPDRRIYVQSENDQSDMKPHERLIKDADKLNDFADLVTSRIEFICKTLDKPQQSEMSDAEDYLLFPTTEWRRLDEKVGKWAYEAFILRKSLTKLAKFLPK
ncbi:MAG: hypothetical protein Q9202_005448 [Teloschistes flavicans]